MGWSDIAPERPETIAEGRKNARKLRLFGNVWRLEGCRSGSPALPRAYSAPIDRNEAPAPVLTRF